MAVGHVASAPLHRRLQRFGELDHQLHAVRRARHAAGDNHGVFRGDEQLRHFRHRAGIAGRRIRQRQLRNAQLGTVLRSACSCRSPSATRTTGAIGTRHGDLVGPHRRLGKMRQRNRRVVPLDVVANHRRRILDAVIPLDSRPPRVGVERVSENDVHGITRDEGVVDGHRRVLQADGPVRHDRHRLAFHSEVAVGDARPTILHGSR